MNKRFLAIIIFVLTVAIAIIALLVGSSILQPPEPGVTPSNITYNFNCIASDTHNLGVDYCIARSDEKYPNEEPTAYGGSPLARFRIQYPGELMIYLAGTDFPTKIMLEVNSNEERRTEIKDINLLDIQVDAATNTKYIKIETGIELQAEDIVGVMPMMSEGLAAGWTGAAQLDNRSFCDDGNGQAAIDFTSLTGFDADREPMNESMQCWAAYQATLNSREGFTAFAALFKTVRAPQTEETPIPGVSGTGAVDLSGTPRLTTTPRAAVTGSITPVISAQVTPPTTPVSGQVACGGSCEQTSDCQTGNSCRAGICVANFCAEDNCINVCQARDAINTLKSASVQCVTGKDMREVTYRIVMVNTVNGSRTVTVTDNLDDSLQNAWIINTSITNGGTISGNTLTWNNLQLPANGSLELKYNVQFPPSEYGKTFKNEVTVVEGTTPRGGSAVSITLDLLPCTALISDEVDRIIIGFVAILIGLVLYKLSIHEYAGNLFWKSGGFKLFSNKNRGLVKKVRREYEQEILKRHK